MTKEKIVVVLGSGELADLPTLVWGKCWRRTTFQSISSLPAHVLISPGIEEFNLLEFHRSKELIDSGEEAANIALSEIRSIIQRNSKNI